MSEEQAKVCVFTPDQYTTSWDENDVEHTKPYLGSEAWFCSECGEIMMGGYECGWFNVDTGRPSFNYCPYCGTKVDIKRTMLLATSEVEDG